MTLIEQTLAGIVVALCAVMLVRLCLGTRLRYRFDAAARRAWFAVKRTALRLRYWRSSRKNAERVAEEAIRRARGGGVQREGNVYKPKSFKGPKKPH
ncbi:hypothetical protein BH11PSE8_BH11PSE8_40270 [soil metagenome]